MSKLEIHKSKNKNAADDSMVNVASDRFYDDEGYEEGDWGRADKAYAPGATYDHEMKMAPNITETTHAEIATKFGYTPTKDYHIRASASNFEHKPSGHMLSVHKDGQWELHGAGHKSGSGVNSLHQHLKKVHFLQQHESTEHVTIKKVLAENGFQRSKGGIYTNQKGSQVKYPLLDGLSYQILESKVIGHTATTLREQVQMKKEKSSPKPVLNSKLLMGVIKEAVEFQKLPTTTCEICGGNHPESKHVKAPGAKQPVTELVDNKMFNPMNVDASTKAWNATKKATSTGKKDDHVAAADMHKKAMQSSFPASSVWRGHHHQFNLHNKLSEGEADEFQANNDAMVGMSEAELTEKRTGIKHNPINQKGSLWQQFKKKLQMEDEDEVPSPDELMKAKVDDDKDGKKVLDELGEAVEKKPWRVIDMTNNRHVDTVHASSKIGAKQAMTKKGHDSRFHMVKEAKTKMPKFDQGKEVRAIARERVGQPKAKTIIKSKKFKQEKHKPDFSKDF